MPKIHLKLPSLTPQQIQAIWKRVDKTPGQGPKGDCWEWTGFRSGGYGQFVTQRTPKRTCLATRLIYLIHHGIDPDQMQVCHHCDNPPCVRPDHLFKGTGKNNMEDCVAKGRIATGSRTGAYTHPERRPRGERHGTRTHPERIARGSRHWSRKYPDKIRRGRQINTVKLTAGDVKTIRKRYAEGARQVNLAADFRVRQPTISCIVRRQTWKHI